MEDGAIAISYCSNCYFPGGRHVEDLTCVNILVWEKKRCFASLKQDIKTMCWVMLTNLWDASTSTSEWCQQQKEREMEKKSGTKGEKSTIWWWVRQAWWLAASVMAMTSDEMDWERRGIIREEGEAWKRKECHVIFNFFLKDTTILINKIEMDYLIYILFNFKVTKINSNRV